MRRFLPFCLVVVVGCTRDVSTKSAASNASRSMSTTHAATSAATAAAAGNQFAFDLFGKLRNQQPGSLFFSPYGIHVAFAMTSAGARGETADELAAALHFDPDQGDFHAALALLAQPLAAGAERDGYQLNIANRLWGQEGYGFVPDFLDLTRNRYGAELANVDFAQLASEPARAAINVWVEAQTKGKIEELIGRGMLDPLTRLVLVNAVYFKGRWKSRFDESNDASFHVSADETVTVPLMSQTGRFKHYVGEGVQI
ncbi:MAG TPA: serpin family protein, partial [Pirellulales bacterium]|nr:serpin family protein [Pirellulales bacterium]